MDECETLCNRLAIMVKGNFRCVGAIQKLKSQYGVGFSLIIKLRNNVITRLKAEAAEQEKKEAEAELKDEVDGHSQPADGVGEEIRPRSKKSSTVITDLKLKVSHLFRCELKDEHEVGIIYLYKSNYIFQGKIYLHLK